MQLAQLRAEAPGFVAASLLDDSVVALPRTVTAPAPPAAAGAGAAGSAAEALPAKGPARRSWPLRLQVRRHKPHCFSPACCPACQAACWIAPDHSCGHTAVCLSQRPGARPGAVLRAKNAEAALLQDARC